MCFLLAEEGKKQKKFFSHMAESMGLVSGGLPVTWHLEFNCFCCHRPFADLPHWPALHVIFVLF